MTIEKLKELLQMPAMAIPPPAAALVRWNSSTPPPTR